MSRFPNEEQTAPPVGLYELKDGNFGKPKTIKYEKRQEEKNETFALQR